MTFLSQKINLEFPFQFGSYHIHIWGKPENLYRDDKTIDLNTNEIIDTQYQELKKYYFDNLGLNLLTLNQVHGKNTLDLDNETTPYPDADSFFTRNINLALAIKTADCVPIMFYHPEKIFFGAIHAGWRGLKLEILKSTLSQIKNDLELDHEKTNLIIGPHISAQNYETSEDVFCQFDENLSHSIPGSDKRNLDLCNIIKQQFSNENIISNRTIYLNHNTYKSSNFFSHRAADKGRNFNIIFFKNPS